MSEQDRIAFVAESILEGKSFAGGNILAALQKIIAALRANGVTWGKIFSLATEILLAITTGQGDWAKIIAEIWQLFFPNNPPPVPVISVP